MSKRHFEKKFKKTISSALAVSIVLGSINIGAVGDSLKGTQENKIVSSAESKLNSLKKIVINNPKKVAGAGLLGLTGFGVLGVILSKLFGKNNSNKKKEEEKEKKEKEEKEKKEKEEKEKEEKEEKEKEEKEKKEKEKEEKEKKEKEEKEKKEKEKKEKKEKEEKEKKKACIESIDCLFEQNFQAPDGSKETWEKRAKEVFGSVDGKELGNKKYAEKFGINETQLRKVANGEYNILNLFKQLEGYYLNSGNDNDRIFNPQRRALLFAIYEQTTNKELRAKCLEINYELSKRALISFLKTYTAQAKLLAGIFLLFQLGELKFTKSDSEKEFEDSDIEIFKAIAQGESVVVTLPEKFKKYGIDIVGDKMLRYNNETSILNLGDQLRTSTHSFNVCTRLDNTKYFCEEKLDWRGKIGAGCCYFKNMITKEIKGRNLSVGVEVCNYNNKKETNELLITTGENAVLFKLEPVASGKYSIYGHEHSWKGGSNNITPTCQFRAWNKFMQRRAMMADLSGCKSEKLEGIFAAFYGKLNGGNFDFEKLIGKQLTVDELSKLIGYEDKKELTNSRNHLAPYESFDNFKELNCCNKAQYGNYKICVEFENNQYRTMTVNSKGIITGFGEFEDAGYRNGCIQLSDEQKNAISFELLSNIKGEFSNSFCKNIMNGEFKIPGVQVCRSKYNCTCYGYVIENIDEFLKWCEDNSVSSIDKKIILLCQNLWLYTEAIGIYKDWYIIKLPKTFREKLEKIKKWNTATDKDKKSIYVKNIKSEAGEWRIYKSETEEFENIVKQLKKAQLNLNVSKWENAFKNPDPSKDCKYKRWFGDITLENFAKNFYE